MAVVETFPQTAPVVAQKPSGLVHKSIEPRPYPDSRFQIPAGASTAFKSSTWFCRLFLATWCGFLFYYGLNAGQLWKTEGLRAIVAAEMLRSGNWIVPTLYGEPLFTKPPGMYAAIALLSLPFGEVTEWTARLPSAIAALLTILMLFGFFSRIFGRRGGLLIAILAPMSPLWLDKATAAEIDMMQVMWVTAANLCLLRALEAEGIDDSPASHSSSRPPHVARTPHGWWLAALLCVAGGVLTKWTAPAFFYATAVPLLVWRGQVRLLFSWRHLVAAVIAAAICMAWIAAAASLTGWAVFYETVKREALQRMLPSFAPAPDPWYVSVMHPFRLWYINLPWSLVALVACLPFFGRLGDGRGRLVWQAMHCWVWPNVVIWSLMLDHKSRHSFPLFPGFAGLATLVWLAWLDGKLGWKWRIKPKRVLVAAVLFWLVTKLVFVEIVAPRNDKRDPRGKAAIVTALVPANSILYLFQFKDETLMFYYGRPVQRLHSPADLPSPSEPLYCILGQAEFERWRDSSDRIAVPLTEGLRDGQGDPIVLVRVE